MSKLILVLSGAALVLFAFAIGEPVKASDPNIEKGGYVPFIILAPKTPAVSPFLSPLQTPEKPQQIGEESFPSIKNPSCRRILMKVTAYTSHCPYFCETFSGTQAGWGTIAVDPAVIDLQSLLFVPDYGIGVAKDTGAWVKGYHIDIWLPSERDALDWGVRNLHVVVCDP